MENYLQELGLLYNTDKSRIKYKNISYLDIYNRYFSKIREEVKTFVEIGILNGSSLKMWRDYFPNATIYGVDIDPRCKAYESDRIKIFIGSQNDVIFLNQLKEEIGEIDVLIDDGSHITNHQITSFNLLYPLIKKGGFYVIEDLLNSYEERWEAWKIDGDVLRQIWPGMSYNDPSDSMMNYRKDFDKFVGEIIKNLDYQTDQNNIIGVHFHSMQVIIENN
jgi:cephalosporin hydroxylase